MNESPDARNMAARAVQNFATQLRESAQANIVSSFRTYLEGGGEGPTDNELRIFARLAAYEHRVRKQRPEGQPSPPPVSRAEFVVSKSLATQDTVAFGDLVDLARYRKGLGGEVCAACQTINPLAAKFCKGCAGRLPAFYAVGAPPSPKPQSEALAVGSRPADAGPPTHTRSRRILVSTAALASAVLLALGAALGPWAGGSSSAISPLRDQPVISSLGAPAAPAAAHAAPQLAAVEEPRAVQQLLLNSTSQPLQASAADDASGSPAGPATVPARKPKRKLAEAPPRNAPRAVARTADPWGPVASCGGLNFLSRAVCVNNVCAQPWMNGSGQCVDAIRQRRLDEARRNPTLMG